MKKYKYYYKSDGEKEAIGRVEATSLKKAIAKASIKKQLCPSEFVKIFNVEEIYERKN